MLTQANTDEVAARPAPGVVLPPHPVLSRFYADDAGHLRQVRLCFDTSAIDYDWVNALFSFGSGRLYRAWALRRFGIHRGDRLLDVGSGTGTLAATAQRMVGAEGLVVALDPSVGMLGRAQARGVLNLVPGRAERLPFTDGSFNRITMGYALRHVADLTATFRELRRVLAPGGSLLLLELTRPASRLGAAVLSFHMRQVIPWAGKIVGRARQTAELMQYSWETIEQCVPPQTILAAMREAGLESVERRSWLRIFSEYSGVKPEQSSGTQAEKK